MAALDKKYVSNNGARFTLFPLGETPTSYWSLDDAPCVSYALRPYGTASGGAPVYQRDKRVGIADARFGVKLEWPAASSDVDASCLQRMEAAAADHLREHPEILFAEGSVPGGAEALDAAVRRARGKNELVRTWEGRSGPRFASVELWRPVFKRAAGKPSKDLVAFADGLPSPLVEFDEQVNTTMETIHQATYDPPTVTFSGDKARLDKRGRAARMALLSLERGERVSVAFTAEMWVTKGAPQHADDAPPASGRPARWGIDLRVERVVVPRWRLYPRASTYASIPEEHRPVVDFDEAAFLSLITPVAFARGAKYSELPLVDPKSGLAVCVRAPPMRLDAERSYVGKYGDAGANRALWEAKLVANLAGCDGGIAAAQAKLAASLEGAEGAASAAPAGDAASADSDDAIRDLVDTSAASAPTSATRDGLVLRTRLYDGLGVRPREVSPKASVENLDAEALKEGYVRAAVRVPEDPERVCAVFVPKAYARDGKVGVRLDLVALEPAAAAKRKAAGEDEGAEAASAAVESPSKRARSG